jgi:hypothetical protein
MAKQDVSTEVLNRLVKRRKEVARRLEGRMAGIGFGKTQLGVKEFQKQVSADGDFRQSMGNQYGPEVLSRLMEGSNAPATKQLANKNAPNNAISEPATNIRPTSGPGTKPGAGPAGQPGSFATGV